MFCTREGLHGESFPCAQFMATKKRAADAVLLVGRGPRMCTDNWPCDSEDPSNPNDLMRRNYTAMYAVLSRPWVSQDAWVMQIPVSTSSTLRSNYFKFSSVVLDTDFPKPPDQAYTRALHGCASRPKDDILVYIARYASSDHKGQQSFLRNVSPEDLQGYTVHFFGDNLKEVANELRSLAASRGIDVQLHGKTEHLKLMEYVCQAKGIVLFSRTDANPRVAYEGLPAGNPVYLSAEISLPPYFRSLPFVFMDSHRKADIHGLAHFHDFMEAVRGGSAEYHRGIKNLAKELLDQNFVYHRICHELGLCGTPLPHQLGGPAQQSVAIDPQDI
mmetsp:Transcript_24341/g.67666  ORF Transcript_24341/g.67666 Transcript_24341/m.67666 type:complete len:330 (-) Transcript_24341:43-1032(-)